MIIDMTTGTVPIFGSLSTTNPAPVTTTGMRSITDTMRVTEATAEVARMGRSLANGAGASAPPQAAEHLPAAERNTGTALGDMTAAAIVKRSGQTLTGTGTLIETAGTRPVATLITRTDTPGLTEIETAAETGTADNERRCTLCTSTLFVAACLGNM